jgi:predicted DNA-binding transcriptional regulator YafY
MGQNGPSITAEKIAQETGVSARTVKRDVQFASAVNKLSPEEKAEVLAGKSGKTKQEILVE